MSLLRALKQETVAILGEFVGTFLFLLIAFIATQTANSAEFSASTGPNIQSLLFISLAFGFALAVNAWAFFRVSGGLFNPAVTLSLFLIGAVKPLRSAGIFVAQVLGGVAAAGVVKAVLPGHPTLAFKTTLAAGMTNSQGLFLEMFVTSQLVITILFLAAEKHKATFIAPVGIGLSLFVGELAAVYYTGGSLNPARSFGPCVIDRDFTSYHWIYWIGPLLGSLLATGFYAINKGLDYEEAVPGQDRSLDPEMSPATMDRRFDSQGQGSRSSSKRRDSGYAQSSIAQTSKSNHQISYHEQQQQQQQQQQHHHQYHHQQQQQPQQPQLQYQHSNRGPGQYYPPVAPQTYQQMPQSDIQNHPSSQPSRRHHRDNSQIRQPRRQIIMHGTG